MLTTGLVSDDVVLASGLSHLLLDQAECEVVFFDACPTSTLTARVLTRMPDILLLDLESGITLNVIEDLRKQIPNCRLCLWGRSIPDDLAWQTMTLGIKGILRRNASLEEVVSCCRQLARGAVWFEERLMTGYFSNRVVRLTRRESQLVGLLAQGLKNKEIAWRLSLSEGTVKVYLSRLFEKLGVRDRFELALYGLRNLSMGDPESLPAGPSPAVAACRATAARP